ncbi:MAG: DUF2403 domain-containing protein [Polyangiales bacterium]
MKRWLLAVSVVGACSSGSAAPREVERPDASTPVQPADAGLDAKTDAQVIDAARVDAAAVDARVVVEDAEVEASAPSACPASTPPMLGTDRYVANTGKTAVDALRYTNVGASGAYAQVIDGWSKATGCVGDSDGSLCRTKYRKPKQVSGALAPFDEDMTLVFGGPIELYRIGIYSPRNGGWARDAYWDRCGTQGLVFAGNKHWYECAGFVESYVSADGTKESAQPVQFAGSIAAGTEVHVNSDGLCTDPESCGWSGGLPLRGFSGDADGSKMFVVELRMPLGDKTPAYWILPSQVVRSSQYGCNCRGQGSDATYKGGCGELDVAEILGGVTTSLEATTTLYSFQDITGGGSVTFARPVNESALFVVIFDAPSRQIAIRRLPHGAFDFASRAADSFVAEALTNPGTVRALR